MAYALIVKVDEGQHGKDVLFLLGGMVKRWGLFIETLCLGVSLMVCARCEQVVGY